MPGRQVFLPYILSLLCYHTVHTIQIFTDDNATATECDVGE